MTDLSSQRVPLAATAFRPSLLRMLTGQLLISIIIGCALSAAPTPSCSPGQFSTTGRIQLIGSNCPVGSNSQAQLTRCGAAFQVDVDSKGIFKVTPLEQGTHTWIVPEGVMKGVQTVNCKLMAAATGLFNAKNPRAADLQFIFFDVVGSSTSELVAVVSPKGKTRLTLKTGTLQGFGDSPGSAPYRCVSTYKVVSGCVLGLTASGTPYQCPSGWKVATGKNGIQFCEQCPTGSSSTGPDAKKCTDCPVGTITTVFGEICTKCPAGQYSPKAGGSKCLSCLTSNPDKKIYEYPAPIYPVAGRACKACPKYSWARAINADQCAACVKGRRCCTTNPDHSCPRCPKGYQESFSLYSDFVLTSSNDPVCLTNSTQFIGTHCPMLSFSAVVLSTCAVVLTQTRSFRSPGCKVGGFEALRPTYSFTSPGKLILNGPLNALQGDANLATSSKGPFVVIQSQGYVRTAKGGRQVKNCLYTYRPIDNDAFNVFARIPEDLSCPQGKPGCLPASGKCPAGHYRQPTVGGTSLCINCWPGTYNPSSTTSTSCKKCTKGIAGAARFGATRCL